MIIIINLFKQQGSRLQEICTLTGTEDRIHGETSYRRLTQRWSTAGAFWSSKGRIVLNNMSAICPESVERKRVCDVIKSRIMGPHRLGDAGGGRETGNLFGVALHSNNLQG